MKKIAIYPGSFDPPTNGHLDLITRASSLFDEIIVAIAENPGKQTSLFSTAERIDLLKDAVASLNLKNVEIDCFEGLLVSYAAQRNARAIIRGLRAVSDFEYEFQMALMNRKLNGQIETIFMMPKDAYTFLSSRIIKEVVRLQGEVSDFVTPKVEAALKAKLNH